MAAPVLGSIGEELDLLIRQGATFGPHTLSMKNPNNTPVDLTGVTFRGKIRKDSKSTISYPITFEVIDAAGGVVRMSMTDEETAVIPAGPLLTHADSKYVWDAEMEDSLGSVIPLYYGKVSVFREITR